MRFCPECGYEINNKEKCYKCGYNNKTKTFDKKVNKKYNDDIKMWKEQSNDNISEIMAKQMIMNAKEMGINTDNNYKEEVHFNKDGCFTEEDKLREMMKYMKEQENEKENRN